MSYKRIAWRITATDVPPICVNDIGLDPYFTSSRPMTILTVLFWAGYPVFDASVNVDKIAAHTRTAERLQNQTIQVNCPSRF